MEVILAIDGGGSRTRCLALDREGTILGAGSAGPSNHLLVDRETVRASISESVLPVLAATDTKTRNVLCVAAGFAGVDYDGSGADEMDAVLRDLGFANMLIEGDMVAAHAGALTLGPGVLALAGTGSSVLGINAAGGRVKVGGWGPVFGDEGSAYRIGQSALRASARYFDGRGPETSLTKIVMREFRIADFRASVDAVYGKGAEPRQIARLSRLVSRAADDGDEVAKTILKRAGSELAECASAAIRRLGHSDGAVRVSYHGSVMTGCGYVRDSFCVSLTGEFPTVSIVRPRFPPVIGAYLLGRRSLGLAVDEGILMNLAAQEFID